MLPSGWPVFDRARLSLGTVRYAVSHTTTRTLSPLSLSDKHNTILRLFRPLVVRSLVSMLPRLDNARPTSQSVRISGEIAAEKLPQRRAQWRSS